MDDRELIAAPRDLADGQRAQVWIANVPERTLTLVHEDAGMLLEAPNWTPDATALILNGDGFAWRLDLGSRRLTRIPLDAPPLNNDHVIHPNGRDLLVSAMDGHIYRTTLEGGVAQRVTDDTATAQFLHGVSPDGEALAYVEIARADFTLPGALAIVDASGGGKRILDTGRGHIDGPEYSPDGEWIYLNAEAFTTEPGHAQLARIRPDGMGFERIHASERVDWFPHLSADGTAGAYISFPPGTLGHPADLPVRISAVRLPDWGAPELEIDLFGGQGTLNVNSWAPDGTRFAFVAYPFAHTPDPLVIDRVR
jgi:TolB protein